MRRALPALGHMPQIEEAVQFNRESNTVSSTIR
jgi:hypothetical protein